jgi:hypothetical protein
LGFEQISLASISHYPAYFSTSTTKLPQHTASDIPDEHFSYDTMAPTVIYEPTADKNFERQHGKAFADYIKVAANHTFNGIVFDQALVL